MEKKNREFGSVSFRQKVTIKKLDVERRIEEKNSSVKIQDCSSERAHLIAAAPGLKLSPTIHIQHKFDLSVDRRPVQLCSSCFQFKSAGFVKEDGFSIFKLSANLSYPETVAVQIFKKFDIYLD